jgi:hypothetical protein
MGSVLCTFRYTATSSISQTEQIRQHLALIDEMKTNYTTVSPIVVISNKLDRPDHVYHFLTTLPP